MTEKLTAAQDAAEVVGRWGDVTIVHFREPARGWGYDVFVGDERVAARVNTENTARWVASNYAPEARPSS